jgi:putative ABC transport system substrate-binding protein
MQSRTRVPFAITAPTRPRSPAAAEPAAPGRRRFAVLLATAAMLPAQADDTPPRVPEPKRLGVFFWHDSPNDTATFAGIRSGLVAAGLPHTFVERQAGGDRTRADTALAELRRLRCDLVFAMGTQAALLARDGLTDVPVVFAAVSDPVASGLVADWQATGTHLCGTSNWIPPQNVLDVFRLAVPGLRRLGVLRSQPSGLVSAAEEASMRAHLAASGASIELRPAVATAADAIPAAVAELLAADVDAIWVPIDLTIYSAMPAVQRALGARKLPLLTTAAAGVQNGAVVGAIADYPLHGRRAAALALDVLVRGKAPGALPIDRMRSSLVVVNLAAARKAGIELPLSLLAIADRLIDPELFDAGR